MKAYLTLFHGLQPIGDTRVVEVATSVESPEHVTWRFAPRGQKLAVPRGTTADGWGFIDGDGKVLHISRMPHIARWGDTVTIAGSRRHQ